MQNTRVKEYFLTENNRWKCKVCAEQKPAILVGNVSHLKNHLHSKHKDIAIELGISSFWCEMESSKSKRIYS